MKTIFKKVTVVSSKGQEVRDVFVDGEKIVEAFDEGEDVRIVEGKGLLMMPGVIDAHVHFREPGAKQKETWETGSKAAVMGGVTTVLDMPNTDPPTMTQAALEAKRELVKGRSHVNYGFHFGASGNFDELEKVEGITGIKVYMGSSTGDLLVDEPSAWEKIFTIAKEKNVPVIVHAENEDRIRSRMTEFAGQTEPDVHAKVRDCECARIATDAAVTLREKVGNKLHIAHMSTKAEAEIVAEHAHEDLSCEVAPHHLFFTMEDMENSLLKMNPPLRNEEDVDALWDAIDAEAVNCIATDHAPHTIKEKAREQAPSGVPGIEFSLPLMLNEVNADQLNLENLVRMMCEEPARIFSLKGKGHIEVGMDADLTLVDMKLLRMITPEIVHSKCGWSPYEGRMLKGWPVLTMVNGTIVMEEGVLNRDLKLGEFVGREVNN